MTTFTDELPACCAVGIMHNFRHDWQMQQRLPTPSSTTGTFVAIFRCDQQQAYLDVCRQHTLKAIVKTPVRPLAVCIFQRGKENEAIQSE